MGVAGTSILVRAHIHDLDLKKLEEYYSHVQKSLKKVDGWLGTSLWKGVDDTKMFLVIQDFTDVPAADLGLHAVATKPLLAESQKVGRDPADVIRVHVEGTDVTSFGKTAKARFLSMSVRVAEPGFGAQLSDEIQRIFEELKLLKGYSCSSYGANDALNEEVIGLVGWETKAAFESSLPDKVLYQVELFERVG